MVYLLYPAPMTISMNGLCAFAHLRTAICRHFRHCRPHNLTQAPTKHWHLCNFFINCANKFNALHTYLTCTCVHISTCLNRTRPLYLSFLRVNTNICAICGELRKQIHIKHTKHTYGNMLHIILFQYVSIEHILFTCPFFE